MTKRLDCVLYNAQARLKWQEAGVSHLPFLSSHPVPLYLQLVPKVKCNPKRRPFRFEAAWLSHDGFKELLRTSWDPSITTPQTLAGLHDTLRRRNREVFGEINTRKEKLLGEIKEVQDLLALVHTEDLLEKEKILLQMFETLLEQEEMLWFQKSREKFIELGDRNTTFFHTSTVIRRRHNSIRGGSLGVEEGGIGKTGT